MLIDYASYAARQNPPITYDALGRYGIPLSAILEIAKECNITFQQGDIFVLRTGYVEAYAAASPEKRQQLADTKPPQFCGLGQSKETTEWLWERQFAAVAADAPAFECSRKSSFCFAMGGVLRQSLRLMFWCGSGSGSRVPSPSYFPCWMGNTDWRVV